MMWLRVAIACAWMGGTAAAEAERAVAVTAPAAVRDPCPPKAKGWTKLGAGGPVAPVGPMRAHVDGAGVVIEGGSKPARLELCSGAWAAAAAATTGPPRPREYNEAGWVVLGDHIWLPGKRAGSDLDVFDNARLQLPGGKTVGVRPNGAPAPRTGYALARTGTHLIVWGGLSHGKQGAAPLGDGAILDLRTRTWRRMAAQGAPSPRFSPVVVWTGTRLIVWGGATGLDVDQLAGDGAIYDPGSDRWTPMAPANAPPPRWAPVVVTNGKHVAVMGGGKQRALTVGGANDRADAFVFDVAANRWRGTTQAPRLAEQQWVRTYIDHQRVIVVDTFRLGVHQLELASGTFLDVKMPRVLEGLSGVASAWTGQRLIVFGGYKQAPGYQNPCANATRECDPPSPDFIRSSEGWIYTP